LIWPILQFEKKKSRISFLILLNSFTSFIFSFKFFSERDKAFKNDMNITKIRKKKKDLIGKEKGERKQKITGIIPNKEKRKNNLLCISLNYIFSQ